MRWRVYEHKGVHVGDLRVRKHFALFPVRVGGFQVWLEFYHSVERCYHVYGGFIGSKWLIEHNAFQQEECFQFLSFHYQPHSYVKSQKLFRQPPEADFGGPWALRPE